MQLKLTDVLGILYSWILKVRTEKVSDSLNSQCFSQSFGNFFSLFFLFFSLRSLSYKVGGSFGISQTSDFKSGFKIRWNAMSDVCVRRKCGSLKTERQLTSEMLFGGYLWDQRLRLIFGSKVWEHLAQVGPNSVWGHRWVRADKCSPVLTQRTYRVRAEKWVAYHNRTWNWL